jgi:hypothetical protein
MKVKSFILALVLCVAAALPAQAGSGLIKITHATRVQPAASTSVKAQPKVSQAKPEFQIAVMVESPAPPTPRRSVFIHR